MKTSVTTLIILLAFGGISYCAGTAETLTELATKTVTEWSNEIYETTTAYRKIQKEEIALAALKNSVRRKLRTANSQFLANTLCSGESVDAKQRVKDLAELYVSIYEPQLIDDIVRDAIEEAIGCKSFNDIVDTVWNLYHEGGLNLYEILVRSQLHLYHSYSKQTAVNATNNIRKLAYSLYKTKQHNYYKLLQLPLKAKIDRIITKFPNNLQYLIFFEYFCLMNSKYSEYVYTAMDSRNLDSTSRYVWVWFEKWSIDDTGYIKAKVFEEVSRNATELMVQMMGIKYQVYYYMQPDRKLIAACDMPSEPVNSFWNIELIDDDRVAFYQQGHIMCSTDERTDEERRLVRGYKLGKYSSKSSECQWLLGSCKRN